MIKQWGRYDKGSIVAEMNTTINFPINFSQFYGVAAITLRGNNTDLGTYAAIGSFSNSSFYVHTVQSGVGGSRYISWIAFGPLVTPVSMSTRFKVVLVVQGISVG